jgi:hypothetical protein
MTKNEIAKAKEFSAKILKYTDRKWAESVAKAKMGDSRMVKEIMKKLADDRKIEFPDFPITIISVDRKKKKV